MKVSVIVPAHNAEHYIAKALSSISVQTLPPWETIIVNDASRDKTASAAKGFCKNFKVISVERRNAAAARNVGIHAATGDYIAFLDADDEWYPHHLEAAVSALSGTSHRGYMAFADYSFVTGESIQLAPYWKETLSRTDEDFLEMFHRAGWFCNCTVLVSRKNAQQLNGFDETLIRRHDFEFFLRVVHSGTWVFSPVPAARIQLGTDGSISSKIFDCHIFTISALRKLSRIYSGSSAFKALFTSRALGTLNYAFAFESRVNQKRVYHSVRDLLTMRRRIIYSLLLSAPPRFSATLLKHSSRYRSRPALF